MYICQLLNLSSIYTHFNKFKKKTSRKKLKLLNFFYSLQSLSQNPLIATFQLSYAVCLNLGRSQNGVLGNGFIKKKKSW